MRVQSEIHLEFKARRSSLVPKMTKRENKPQIAPQNPGFGAVMGLRVECVLLFQKIPVQFLAPTLLPSSLTRKLTAACNLSPQDLIFGF